MAKEDDFIDSATESEGDYKDEDLGLTSDDVREKRA